MVSSDRLGEARAVAAGEKQQQWLGSQLGAVGGCRARLSSNRR